MAYLSTICVRSAGPESDPAQPRPTPPNPAQPRPTPYVYTEQVNVRNKKRRQIRRVKLRRGSEFDVELEEPEEPFKKGDEVMITKPDSRMQGETGVVLQAVGGMAKVEVMSASAGVNKGKIEVYAYNHLRLLADNHV